MGELGKWAIWKDCLPGISSLKSEHVPSLDSLLREKLWLACNSILSCFSSRLNIWMFNVVSVCTVL